MSVAKPLLALLLTAPLVGCGGFSTSHVGCGTDQCTAAQLTLAVEVVPDATGSIPSQEFTGLTISDSLRLDLDAPIHIRGTVKRSDGKEVGAVTVAASRPSRILGHASELYQSTSSATTGAYDLAVPPARNGELYTIHVAISATELPPYLLQISPVANQTLDLTLPAGNDLQMLSGSVLDAVGGGVSGLDVQLTDATGQAISTRASTASDGSFTVGFASGSTPAALLATPDPSAAPGLPTVTRDLSADDLSYDVTLQLPALPTARQVSYLINGQSSSGTMEPVAGATCVFTALIASPSPYPASSPGPTAIPAGGANTTVSYSITATSDSNGLVTVPLLPTSGIITGYQVAVFPPSTSVYAANTTATNLLVGVGQGVGATLTLPPRTTVSGRVLAPSGTPLSGVNLSTIGSTVDSTTSTLAAMLANVQLPTSTTDSGGNFVLQLDPGSYDFGLQPPVQSGLPNLWIDNQPVSGTGSVALGDLTLLPATTVSGLIRDGSGQPLAGATILVYEIGVGSAACHADDSSCQPPPRLLAQTTTLSDGTLNLLLPSSDPTQ